MYNQSQGSFGQPVQSQYRGFQKQFQPTGPVQSFYNQSGFSGSQQTQNYHTQNYVGNRQDHDVYLREDSLSSSTYATGRGQGISTLNNVQPSFSVNAPTSQIMAQGRAQSQGQGQIQNQSISQNQSFQQTNPNSYHLANYAGNRQDHDAYLRADSLRPSSYSTGRSQGISTLNNAQPVFSVNTPTSQFTSGAIPSQQQFGQFRSF